MVTCENCDEKQELADRCSSCGVVITDSEWVWKTKPTVKYAEIKAIDGIDEKYLKDTTLVVTTTPCKVCAEKIIEVGIKKVIYVEIYKNYLGALKLEKAGIEVERYLG